MSIPRTPQDLETYITRGALDQSLQRLYPDDETAGQRRRYADLVSRHRDRFGAAGEIRLFSTPGRTEIGGNHTDHNHGRVLAGSVTLDAVAAVTPLGTGDLRCILTSTTLNREYHLDLGNLEPQRAEEGTTEALIRGTAAWFSNQNLNLGGFYATVDSRVLPGSGLSSSACIEVLLATILDRLYNAGKLGAVGRALCGRFAENRFFGKPSGLMDQLACSLGGLAMLDFADPQKPGIQGLEVDFNALGYQLCIVDTQSDHSTGTADYAAIPREMKLVAQALGREVLGQIDPRDFWTALPDLRTRLPGRALCRAGHFFQENQRVTRMFQSLAGDAPGINRPGTGTGFRGDTDAQAGADGISGGTSATPRGAAEEPKSPMTPPPSKEGQETGLGESTHVRKPNIEAFLALVRESGHSSFEYLQNVVDQRENQDYALALLLTSQPPWENRVVSRVHGGGFGGTIQAYVPRDLWPDFQIRMEAGIGPGAVHPLTIRNLPSLELDEV